jgi:hypothetical protein
MPNTSAGFNGDFLMVTVLVPTVPAFGVRVRRARFFVREQSWQQRAFVSEPERAALKALGDERVVLILNTEFGGPHELPFDLRRKRVMTYTVRESSDEHLFETKM